MAPQQMIAYPEEQVDRWNVVQQRCTSSGGDGLVSA